VPRAVRGLCGGFAPTEGQLGRLRSPIGLGLGARTAKERAVVITAEIIAGADGAAGLPLARLDGPIHGVRPERSVVKA